MNKKSYSSLMELNPQQLRYLREQRRLTREELAAELDCSASAIVQWEGGKRAIPSWVADKMFSKMEINFTIEELSELFELCREQGMTFSELLQDAARSLIAERKTSTDAGKIPPRRNVTYQPPRRASSMAAEEKERYQDKTGTED